MTPSHPQFKLQCRKLGIKRWPYRKLKGLATVIETCRKEAAGTQGIPSGMPGGAGGAATTPAAWAERLEALQARSPALLPAGAANVPPSAVACGT